MARILLTAGPIPAKLDSVKFLTNRFKGGLAIKTAKTLVDLGHEVTVVAWKHTDVGDIQEWCHLNFVDDVNDYVEKVLSLPQHDMYVLAAAVANLMPSAPYEGKFPSHNYKVGDKFNIEFKIAPRLIDMIKEKYPRSSLVGYKLFDGSDEELIKAATHTLHDSKANLVFANHPVWAKERKIALTQDGSIFDCSFDEHVELINKLAKAKFYSTWIRKTEGGQRDYLWNVVDRYPRYIKDGRMYGTFAVRSDGDIFNDSFYTTTRGKAGGDGHTAFVDSVDHLNRIVYSDTKATLNAPLLHRMLQINPHLNILVHGHILIGETIHDEYEFPGSDGDLKFAKTVASGHIIQLKNHGYLVGFSTIEEFNNFKMEL